MSSSGKNEESCLVPLFHLSHVISLDVQQRFDHPETMPRRKSRVSWPLQEDGVQACKSEKRDTLRFIGQALGPMKILKESTNQAFLGTADPSLCIRTHRKRQLTSSWRSDFGSVKLLGIFANRTSSLISTRRKQAMRL